MNSETLRRLAAINMPAEALREVLIVLAETMAKDEERKAKEAARKKQERAVKRAASADNPRTVQGQSLDNPPPLSPSLPSPTPPIEPPPISPSPSSLRSVIVFNPVRAREDFSRFWQIYPRREGANPRQPAEQKFVALVRAGEDAEAIISGAAAYAASVAQAPPKFTTQAITWLNQGRWRDDHSLPAARAGPETMTSVLNDLKRKVKENAEQNQQDIKDITPRTQEPGNCGFAGQPDMPPRGKMVGGTVYDLRGSSPDSFGAGTADGKAWRTG